MSPSSITPAPPPPIVKPPLPPEIEELHAKVVAAGEETYTDPATGYMVMSGLYHTYVSGRREGERRHNFLGPFFRFILDSFCLSLTPRTHSHHTGGEGTAAGTCAGTAPTTP